LEGKEFASLEEVKAFLATQMSKRNQAPKKDFAGLSPEQIHRYCPRQEKISPLHISRLDISAVFTRTTPTVFIPALSHALANLGFNRPLVHSAWVIGSVTPAAVQPEPLGGFASNCGFDTIVESLGTGFC